MRYGKALPTVKVFGPRGPFIINESDLPEWQKKGYSTQPPKTPEKQPHPSVDPDESGKPKEPTKAPEPPKQPDPPKGKGK